MGTGRETDRPRAKGRGEVSGRRLALEGTPHDVAEFVVPLQHFVDDPKTAGAQPARFDQANDDNQGAAQAKGEPEDEFSHRSPAFPAVSR